MSRQKEKIRKQNKQVMHWHGAFPAQPREQGAATIFTVRSKGRKIHNDEIGKRKKCEWNAEQQEAMRLVGLENIRNGGDHVSNVRGKHTLSKPTIDEPKRRNRVAKNEEQRKEQEEKSRNREVVIVIKNKCDHRICRERRNGNIQRVV